MAQTELNVILKLVDEASAKIKTAMDGVKQGTDAVAKSGQDAGKKLEPFNKQLKDAGNNLRDIRRTAFIATAALATVIASVKEASEYNQGAKNTFDAFSISVKSFSVNIGQYLEPALQGVTQVVNVLRDSIEAAIAGAIKMGTFITEFFTTIGRGPVEAWKRATEVANTATDTFLQKIEETRARVEAGITLDNMSEQTVNLEKIVVKSAKTMKQHWDSVKDAVSNLGAALEGASELGKGFAKAAAAIALGMAIVNTAQGITAALSGPPNGPPWPMNLALAALIAATGAIQIATISATKFHSGGMIRAHDGLAVDEVPIIAQTGEGVLSRRGMAAIGGERALNSLNNGQGGGAVNVNVYYPKMSSRDEVAELARTLGLEISRELNYARAI